MDTLDNETIEQIKNIVNDAKNEAAPLQKAKRVKKSKAVENVPVITPEPELMPAVDPVPVPEVLKRPRLSRSKTIKNHINIVPVVEPEPEPVIEPEPVVEPEPEPVLQQEEQKQPEEQKPPEKKKRVQSEKQKAAFVLLQEKRREQVEKLKLLKKIEASKVLLENDIPLKVKKPKRTTINFDEDGSSDDETTEEEEKPKRVPKVQQVSKQWGTSTRNKKSVKPVQVVNNESNNYEQPTFF